MSDQDTVISEFSNVCRELVETIRANRLVDDNWRKWTPRIIGLYGLLLAIMIVLVVLNTQARLSNQLRPATPSEIASEVVRAMNVSQTQNVTVDRASVAEYETIRQIAADKRAERIKQGKPNE